MDISREISSRKVISVETVLLYCIQIATILAAILGILYLQVGFSGIAGTLINYSRLLICLMDIFFLLIHYFRRGAMPLATIKVFLILLYVLSVAFFIYRPGTILVISNMFPWPLTYLVFFAYTKDKELPKSFRYTVAAGVLICGVLFIRTLLTRYSKESNIGSVYQVVVYLPLILLLFGKNGKLVFSVFTTLLLIASTKRAGLLAIAAGFCGYFVLTAAQQGTLKKRLKSIIGITVGGVVCLAAVLYYIEATNSKILDRLANISEDGGSGRTEMWMQILSSFHASSMTQKLFGHGFHAVPYLIKPFGQNVYAHNSYIEFLYDLGIVGLAFLICIVVDMVRFLLRLIKEKNPLAPSAFFAMCIVLMFSMVSYWFEESGTIMMVAIYWGIARGSYARILSSGG